MPYQCTACNKRFRYKISQRTHKCSANPPGVVVRTNGYLVERLQAAMIKASVESDKKTRQNEMDEKLPSCSQVSAPSEATSSQKFGISSSLPNRVASSDVENNKTEGNFSETADLEKNNSDKPQIYLLVKGPNEETYYQPIILSQNNNLILNQNNSVQSSGKYLIKSFKSKPMEKTLASDKHNTNFEMNISDVLMDSVDTNPSLHDGVQSIPKTITQEKGNDDLRVIHAKDDSYQSIKNSSEWIEKNGRYQSVNKENESSTILSDEFEMNDIISSLTCQFSENCPEESNQNVNSSKSGSNGNIVMMDSNDIFSLILSPSQSQSPSERFGRLSLSPITINQQALTSSNFDPGEVLPDNFNNSNQEQQDCIFDSINDDTLKELLFGSSK